MIDETNRRRETQVAYNLEHGIIPTTIIKSVEEIELQTRVADARGTKYEVAQAGKAKKLAERKLPFGKTPEEVLKDIERQMRDAAAQLDFEQAALLRDQYLELKAEIDGAKPSPTQAQRRQNAGLRPTV